MRKLLLTTAAVAAAIAGAVAGEPSFGTFTDTRDGQTYKTVKIGKQTWMAQNLNYLPPKGKSWCYNNDTSYCNKYGRLYDWHTAKKACMNGWHLPTSQEWDNLGKAVGGEISWITTSVPRTYWLGAGKKLKAKSGWKRNIVDSVSGNGTDDFGFSALPGGRRITNYGFNLVGERSYWWTPDLPPPVYAGNWAYTRELYNDSDELGEQGDIFSYGFSVRCVADTP